MPLSEAAGPQPAGQTASPLQRPGRENAAPSKRYVAPHSKRRRVRNAEDEGYEVGPAHSAHFPLLELPEAFLHRLLTFTDVFTVISMQQTCKRLQTIGK